MSHSIATRAAWLLLLGSLGASAQPTAKSAYVRILSPTPLTNTTLDGKPLGVEVTAGFTPYVAVKPGTRFLSIGKLPKTAAEIKGGKFKVYQSRMAFEAGKYYTFVIADPFLNVFTAQGAPKGAKARLTVYNTTPDTLNVVTKSGTSLVAQVAPLDPARALVTPGNTTLQLRRGTRELGGAQTLTLKAGDSYSVASLKGTTTVFSTEDKVKP